MGFYEILLVFILFSRDVQVNKGNRVVKEGNFKFIKELKILLKEG